jgi:hypothetical protein
MRYPRAFPEHLCPIVRDFYACCDEQTSADAQLDQLLAAGPARS